MLLERTNYHLWIEFLFYKALEINQLRLLLIS